MTGSCVPGVGGSGHITVTAYFSDSAGLFTGNDVGILGVPVGRVTKIEPDGGRVKVTLEIDTDHPIPADAGAVVVARSVATDRYVELTPVYHDGPKLKDGATIAVDSTRTPVDFDQVLETIDQFATGIAGSKETTDAIRRFVEAGDAAFSGQGEQLHETITKLSDAATDVGGQRGEIVATLDSLDSLVAAIDGNEQTVRTFLRRVAQGSALLNDQRTEFRESLRALDRAVHTVAAFAVKNRGQIVKAHERLGRHHDRADEEAAAALRDPRGDAAGAAEPRAAPTRTAGCRCGSTRRSWRRWAASSARSARACPRTCAT